MSRLTYGLLVGLLIEAIVALAVLSTLAAITIIERY